MIPKNKTRITITITKGSYIWLKAMSKPYGSISRFIQTWIGNPDYESEEDIYKMEKDDEDDQ